MNKNSIIPALVIVAVLIVGGVFIFENNKGETANQPVVTATPTEVATITTKEWVPPKNSYKR